MAARRSLPWENEPYVNHVTAQEKALEAAKPRYVDLTSTAVKSWARRAFDNEIVTVRNQTQPGRNHQLFVSGAALFEIVAAGALDEDLVINALRDACRDNRLEYDDGERAVLGTIASARRHGVDNPRDLSGVGQHKRNGAIYDDAPAQAVKLDVIGLERGFWTQRDTLQRIYLGALSRMCSPWAVLGYCAARALTLVRPNATLPPLIGGRGSLNWFCAIAAVSGGGKGSASAVAKELVNDHVLVRNLGSGEGLIDAYRCKEDENAGGVRESVMFVADEIDNMTALSARSGSTLMSTLRSAFSGETLGFSYRSNKFHLDAHSYRMTLVVSVQPARASMLMDDLHGGTLQRFMWFPGADPRITNEIPMMPAPLELPHAGKWLYDREIRIPIEAAELIRDERVRINRGDEATKGIDGHALFIREKFAYALACLDGRDEMNSEDWRLSGIAARVSDHTREWVSHRLLAAQQEEHTRIGSLRGVESAAADEKKLEIGRGRVNDAARWAMGKLADGPDDGVTNRELAMACPKGSRAYLKSALEGLEEAGRISRVVVENRTGPKGLKWMRTEV